MDWLRLGGSHPVVRLTRWCERVMGSRANAHFCVSRAMRADLARNWGIEGATVLYDRPLDAFAPTSLEKRHELFRMLQHNGVLPGPASEPRSELEAIPKARHTEETLVTTLSSQKELCLRPDRPALIMSPTSWTVDEDFDLLVEALALVNEAIDKHDEQSPDRPFPCLLFLITGRGPLREEFEKKANELSLRKSPVVYPVGCRRGLRVAPGSHGPWALPAPVILGPRPTFPSSRSRHRGSRTPGS